MSVDLVLSRDNWVIPLSYNNNNMILSDCTIKNREGMENMNTWKQIPHACGCSHSDRKSGNLIHRHMAAHTLSLTRRHTHPHIHTDTHNG